ncbi:MAG TPA: pitrilysin family protein [Pyrinomonadaceae bacterium]|nr:pitrilysin family protein [Pyrinomonadaceae bacterium]
MNWKKYFAIICTLTLVAVPLRPAAAVQDQPAQKQQKQSPPEGGKPKAFTLPQKETFTLANGLKATLVPYGALPKVTVSIIVRAGNLNESEKQVWLADLTGTMLKEGTTSRSAEDVAQRAASMGGSLSVNVGADQTAISGDVLSEFGPDLVTLLAEVVQKPLLPASELPRLKGDLLRQLTISKSQPGPLALERFRKLLYPSHPYGRLFPTEEMIKSYTIEDVQKFYKENFGAARTHVFVAGQLNAALMKKAIRQAFEGWARGPDPVENIPKPVAERTIQLIDRPGAAQSTIYIGLPVIDPSHADYVPLLVTNTLLGGFFSSRITSNIREQKGYTYSPFSSVSARYRDAYWTEVADVTTNVTGPSLKEIFYEIDRLQKEPPSEEELDGIKNYLAGIFVLQNSSRSGVINQLAFLNLHQLGDKYLTDYVQNVYAVTPKDVQRIAQTYLQDEKMAVVIVGDREKIAKEVSAFGEVTN